MVQLSSCVLSKGGSSSQGQQHPVLAQLCLKFGNGRDRGLLQLLIVSHWRLLHPGLTAAAACGVRLLGCWCHVKVC
jgi:hypothetical protein